MALDNQKLFKSALALGAILVIYIGIQASTNANHKIENPLFVAYNNQTAKRKKSFDNKLANVQPKIINSAKVTANNDGWLVTGVVDGHDASYQFSLNNKVPDHLQGNQLIFYQYQDQVVTDKDNFTMD